MMRYRLFLVLILVGFCGNSYAIPQSISAYKKGEILVKFRPGKVLPMQLQALLQPEPSLSSVGGSVSGATSNFIVKKLLTRDTSSATPFSVNGKYLALSDKLKMLNAITEFDRFYSVGFNEAIPVAEVLGRIVSADMLEYSQPNYIYHMNTVPVATPNDPGYSTSYKYELVKLNMSVAWDLSLAVYSPVVGVVDTGVDYNHPDLAANMWTDGFGHYGHNSYDNSNDPMDYDGHGTHVAGIIAAGFNNGIGSLGVATNAKIMGLKVFDPSGNSNTGWMLDALTFALNKVDIINMSMGGPSSASDTALHNGCDLLAASNVLLIAAAGNDAQSTINLPAVYPSVMAVGALNANLDNYAVNSDWGLGYGSNYGPELSVVAPGTTIFSTYSTQYNYGEHGPGVIINGAHYNSMSGTSQATPEVAGLAALIKQTYPLYSAAQMRAIIENSADDLGVPGHNDYTGYGRINPVRAMIMADNIKPVIIESLTDYYPDMVVVITANIIDNLSSVLTENIRATLNWKSASANSYIPVVMSRASIGSSLFQVTLPTATADVTINYYIVARDINNNTVTSNIKTIANFDHTPPVLSVLSLNNLFPGRYIYLNAFDWNSISNITITLNTLAGAVVATGSIVDGKIEVAGNDYKYQLPSSLMSGTYKLFVGAADSKGNSNSAIDMGTFSIVSDFQFSGPSSNISIPVLAPNPWNPGKTPLVVGFCLTKLAIVNVFIFDLTGNLIYKTLVESPKDNIDRYYEITWDGNDLASTPVKNGVYIIVLEAITEGKKIVSKLKVAVLR